MSLHEINKGIHKHKKPNRKGRGIGSGQGKTAGRGGKGQFARTGWKALPIFQGGSSPLVRRIPKRGFTNSWAVAVAEINVGDLEELFDTGATITPESLREAGILKKRFDVLKVLGDGELTKKLSVSAHRFSASAKEKFNRQAAARRSLPGQRRSPSKRGPRKPPRPRRNSEHPAWRSDVCPEPRHTERHRGC
jgi:large subunit ribosomal protein L15